MKNISLLILIVLLFLPLAACSDDGWHTLKKLTPSERASASYKFLVSKFGDNHISVECDPEGAARLGGNYLIYVLGDRKDVEQGETLGHGATLQDALDNAASSYISPSTVRALRSQKDQDDNAINKRATEYRKKCFSVNKP